MKKLGPAESSDAGEAAEGRRLARDRRKERKRVPEGGGTPSEKRQRGSERGGREQAETGGSGEVHCRRAAE